MSLDSYAKASLWRDKSEAWHEPMPGVQRRILAHSSSGLMVLYKIQPGRIFPSHNHPHTQYGIFLEGGGSFHVGESDWEVRAGDTYFIPPGVYHELKTATEKVSLIVDFFTPERTEYARECLPPDQF